MVRAAVAVALGLAAALPAAAQWDTKREAVITQVTARQVNASFGAIMSPHVGYSTLTGGVGQSATMTSIKTGPGAKSGDVIDVEVKRVLTQPRLAKAIARNLPLIGTAVTIADLLEEVRISEGPGGTILMDPGAAPIDVNGWNFTLSANNYTLGPCTPPLGTLAVHTAFGATKAAARAAWIAWVQGQYGSGCTRIYADGSSTVYSWTWSAGGAEQTVTRNQCFQNFNAQGNPSGAVNCTSNQSAGGTFAPRTEQGCPEGQSIAWWDVTKCTTAPPDWDVVDETIATPRIEPKLAQRPAGVVAGELIGAGAPIEHDAPTLDPVPERYVERELTRNPDGTVSVRDTIWTYIPGAGRYEWSPRIVEKDYPDEASVPPPGQIDGGTETEGTPPPVPVELLTCGLPGTPPCKIDESGTPPPTDPFADRDPDDWFEPLRGVFENPPVADTSWTFTFQLPSHCSAIPVGIGDYTVSIDLCQWQPMIHDILSMVWVAAGLWFAIGMVGRTLGGA